MKFNIGDRVKIRDRETIINVLGLSQEMGTYAGRIARIRGTYIYPDSYVLDSAHGISKYFWPAEALSLLYIPEPFELGCMVSSDKFELAVIAKGNESEATCAVLIPEKSHKTIVIPWASLRLFDSGENISIEAVLANA